MRSSQLLLTSKIDILILVAGCIFEPGRAILQLTILVCITSDLYKKEGGRGREREGEGGRGGVLPFPVGVLVGVYIH